MSRTCRATLPVVAVEAGPDEAVPVVAVDQVAGAAAATRHLLELGHRTVWHLAGPRTGSRPSSASTAGWPRWRRRAPTRRRCCPATGARASGYELGRRLATVRDVTAIFAANDQMALGLLRRCTRPGRDVPGEVSIVGFDDIPEAQFFTPPLTTVHQDFNEVGRRGLDAAARDRRGRTLVHARDRRGGAHRPREHRAGRPRPEPRESLSRSARRAVATARASAARSCARSPPAVMSPNPCLRVPGGVLAVDAVQAADQAALGAVGSDPLDRLEHRRVLETVGWAARPKVSARSDGPM